MVCLEEKVGFFAEKEDPHSACLEAGRRFASERKKNALMEQNASLPVGVLRFSKSGLGCTHVLVITCSLLSRLSSALLEKLGCYLGSLEF